MYGLTRSRAYTVNDSNSSNVLAAVNRKIYKIVYKYKVNYIIVALIFNIENQLVDVNKILEDLDSNKLFTNP